MSVTKELRIEGRQTIPEGITRQDTYTNGKPQYGGVNDPRMGTMDRRAPCKTCGCSFNETGQKGRVNECPGHFGHMVVRRWGETRRGVSIDQGEEEGPPCRPPAFVT